MHGRGWLAHVPPCQYGLDWRETELGLGLLLCSPRSRRAMRHGQLESDAAVRPRLLQLPSNSAVPRQVATLAHSSRHGSGSRLVARRVRACPARPVAQQNCTCALQLRCSPADGRRGIFRRVRVSVESEPASGGVSCAGQRRRDPIPGGARGRSRSRLRLGDRGCCSAGRVANVNKGAACVG